MKKIVMLLLCGALVLALAACTREKSTGNPTPEDFSGEDIFYYEGVVWLKATDVDWVAALDLPEGEELGTIQRTGVRGDWREWDASVLPAGTAILAHAERNDILIALEDGVLIPYLKIVEG